MMFIIIVIVIIIMTIIIISMIINSIIVITIIIPGSFELSKGSLRSKQAMMLGFDPHFEV